MNSKLNWPLAAMFLFTGACGGEETPLPPTKVTVPGLALDIDPSVAPWTALPDRSAEVTQVTPWDNFATRDTLNDQVQVASNLPDMELVAKRDAFFEDPIMGILRQGKINFWIVAELYRNGVIKREDRAEIYQQLEAKIAASPEEHAFKINALVGLIHLGFDREAMQLIDRYHDEPWFLESWDATFYAGSMYFRYYQFGQAVPLLEQALKLHPDPFSRLWLAIALTRGGGESASARQQEVFAFGEHVGGGSVADFPFQNIAEQLGIRRGGLVGAMSFLDVNNDDYLDILNNSAYGMPELRVMEPGRGYVQVHDATLEDAHNTPPGSLAADFDNDGWTDIYMTQAAWFSAGPNRMLRNLEGNGWEDVSLQGDQSLSHQNSCGVSTLDYNHDGLLDLVVTGTAGGTLHLLQNMGDFIFEDVTDAAGIKGFTHTAVGLAVGDVNGDGWDDIFVNGYTDPDPAAVNQLYINQGDGTFSEEAKTRGDLMQAHMGFGSWMFDYDNDGDFDILASVYASSPAEAVEGFSTKAPHKDGYQPSALYKNDGEGNFELVSEAAGFVPANIMGAHYVDFELDGDLDVVLGSGSHPLPTMQPVFFYRNDGNDQFTNITPMYEPEYYGKFHGMAFADYDHDGDPDFYVNNGGVLLSDRFRDLFLENTTTGKRWVHIKLVGTDSNRDGVGTKVSVRVGERTLHQQRIAGQGFSSTTSPVLIFGLDEAEVTGEVTLRWPSGLVQTLPPLAADQAIEVTEGSSAYRRMY